MQCHSSLARGQTMPPFLKQSRQRKHSLQQQVCHAWRHAPVASMLGLDSHILAPQRRWDVQSLGLQQPLRVVRTATASKGGAAVPASQPTAGATPPTDASTAGSRPAQAADGGVDTDEIDVRRILSDPDIEGDPLQFLKVTEAYWKVQRDVSCLVLSCLVLSCLVLASLGSRAVQEHGDGPTSDLVLPEAFYGHSRVCQMPCRRVCFQALRQSKHNPGKRGPTVVTKRYRALGATDYDVCVAGGTLGVFLALALQVNSCCHDGTCWETHCTAWVPLRAADSGDAKLTDLRHMGHAAEGPPRVHRGAASG